MNTERQFVSHSPTEMNINDIFPEEVLKDRIIEYFPADYFNKWERKFGHHFLSAHMARTYEYDTTFVAPELAGHSVLEVGGYPGLLIACYLLRGCDVVAIDSPFYRPKEYTDFVDSAFFKSIEFDINEGNPPLHEDTHFDFCVMSDVLLHNEGFPSEFISWVLNHCDKFYMINYSDQDGNIRNTGKSHSLHSGWSIPSKKAITEELGKLGGRLVSERVLKCSRDILVFEKDKPE